MLSFLDSKDRNDRPVKSEEAQILGPLLQYKVKYVRV